MKRLNFPHAWDWSALMPARLIEVKCLHKLVLKDKRKNILSKNTFNLKWI